MIKTALNAMSRKGYRRLDLAHRMFNRAEDEMNKKTPDSHFPKTTQRRLDSAKNKLSESRHDLLHPKGRNSDILHGLTIRGHRSPDRVKPSLARKSRVFYSEHRNLGREWARNHMDFSRNKHNEIIKKYPNQATYDQNHPMHQQYANEYNQAKEEHESKAKKIIGKSKKVLKKFDSIEDSHLYKPEVVSDGEHTPSTRIKDRLGLQSGSGKIRFKGKKSYHLTDGNSSSLKNDRQMSIVKDTINSAVNRVRKR